MKKVLMCFFVIGIMILGGSGYLFIKDYNFKQSAVSAKGVIVDLDRSVKKSSSSSSSSSTSYYPIVGFFGPDGKKITFRSDMGSSSYADSYGEVVDVLYDPDNPGNAKINPQSTFLFYFAPFMMAIMGLTFTLVGSVPLYLMRRKQAMGEMLKRTGKPVTAKITEVRQNSMLEVNGVHPYRIVAQFTDSANQTKTFYSANLFYNPERDIDRNTVTVYVDRNNEKKYYMDISFLPAE
ncbi:MULTISPECIES: DUF3592 domain-containing protein [unclassified Brenneria]|uniref:DUF3592 domain-containing protein n=1 Tax=unclassified Brenneria TaxID=2634434 RepID=UPI0029C13F03|nr:MULTISPECIES: DUF3592 domain-containing protein [unclassified Brenneria]MDX5630533.1 DUF3592 domain-containing protein [Brenneria sp. L3-3Z]MDX5697658.1 DUF3592 domain-containing protein [Brenneria sp. L4-2C]